MCIDGLVNCQYVKSSLDGRYGSRRAAEEENLSSWNVFSTVEATCFATVLINNTCVVNMESEGKVDGKGLRQAQSKSHVTTQAHIRPRKI